MIFITTLEKPAEGSPIDGADGADQPLWQVVEFNCWLPTLPCTFCPGLKKEGPRRESKPSTIWAK